MHFGEALKVETKCLAPQVFYSFTQPTHGAMEASSLEKPAGEPWSFERHPSKGELAEEHADEVSLLEEWSSRGKTSGGAIFTVIG